MPHRHTQHPPKDEAHQTVQGANFENLRECHEARAIEDGGLARCIVGDGAKEVDAVGQGHGSQHRGHTGSKHHGAERGVERAHMSCLTGKHVVDGEEGHMQHPEDGHPVHVKGCEQGPCRACKRLDDTQRVELTGHANQHCKPHECVPCGRVGEAVAPAQHPRGQQYTQPHHGCQHCADANGRAGHPQDHCEGHGAKHDLLITAHGAHCFQPPRRILGRLWCLCDPRGTQLVDQQDGHNHANNGRQSRPSHPLEELVGYLCPQLIC
mmetsp:Transcript_912/g.1364  ORF Transcript_912/g.1364 Transcript_912/m.1364 type:complete len:266 (-) Transcript_912:979-1776(-)